MNDQIARTTRLTACSCCNPAQPLETGDQPARFAACSRTGLWHENRGDGIFVLSATTPAPANDQWANGGNAPVLAPGVRIDLSRESYA